MAPTEGLKDAFGEPRRQHFLGTIRYFTRNINLLVRSFLPILAGLALSDEFRRYIEVIAAAVLALVTIAAIIEFWRFRFHVDNHSIIIEKGLLEREVIAIPFDRIQALHLEQAPWQRFFSLTTLKIDTAGTSGAEVDLQALKLSEANDLRDGIMAARSVLVSSAPESDAEPLPLVYLSPKALLKVGVTQDHLRNGFIALGAVIALYEPFKSLIDTWLSAVPEIFWSILSWTWFLFIPLGVFLFLILSFVVSSAGAILRYFDLKAMLYDREISLKAGLLRRFEYRIPLAKIQILEWRSNLLRRALSIETLRVFQASAQDSDSPGKGLSMSVPGISPEASSNLASAVFESLKENNEVERIIPAVYLYHRFLILRILIGSVVMIAASSGVARLFLIGCVIVWSFHSARKKFENYWLLVTPDVCQMYDGWLRKKRSMFSFFKLQRVALYQNRLMRKRGVAHITFATAAGNRTFKFLNENDAKRLYNWSLMKIEQGPRNWM
jgi:putative membrane protein